MHRSEASLPGPHLAGAPPGSSAPQPAGIWSDWCFPTPPREPCREVVSLSSAVGSTEKNLPEWGHAGWRSTASSTWLMREEPIRARTLSPPHPEMSNCFLTEALGNGRESGLPGGREGWDIPSALENGTWRNCALTLGLEVGLTSKRRNPKRKQHLQGNAEGSGS